MSTANEPVYGMCTACGSIEVRLDEARRTNRDHEGQEALLTTHGIKEAHAAGQGVHAIAERFGVSLNAVRHVINGGKL